MLWCYNLAPWVSKPNENDSNYLPFVMVPFVSVYYNLAPWIAKPKGHEFNFLSTLFYSFCTLFNDPCTLLNTIGTLYTVPNLKCIKK